MAKITEPAEPIEPVNTFADALEAVPEAPGPRHPDTRVYVYDTNSGEKLAYPVPVTWLDGRFPNIKEVPSTSKEK